MVVDNCLEYGSYSDFTVHTSSVGCYLCYHKMGTGQGRQTEYPVFISGDETGVTRVSSYNKMTELVPDMVFIFIS